jgi:syntaxin 18
VAKTTAAAQAEGMTNNQPVQLTIPTLSGEDESQPTPTQEQIQQFAEENSHLLTQMSSTLTTVLSAESSILEISQLQSSLIAHLHAQSETIDRLYDDAIGTVADVEKANKELRKAKERSGEARIFLLVFLIGGSLTLLFLDWYS